MINYIMRIDGGTCNGCGICVEGCPLKALTFESNTQKNGKNNGKPPVHSKSKCIVCFVCEHNCPKGAISLVHRDVRVRV